MTETTLDEMQRKSNDTFPHDKILQDGKLLKTIDTKYHTAKFNPKDLRPEYHMKQSKIETKQHVDLKALKDYKLK